MLLRTKFLLLYQDREDENIWLQSFSGAMNDLAMKTMATTLAFHVKEESSGFLFM